MKYLEGIGKPPVDLGIVECPLKEMMFYLYLPIKMPGQCMFRTPRRLRPVYSILNSLTEEFNKDLDGFYDKYVYLTAKRMFVSPGFPGNRPGWHIDGFGSNGDINYIWADLNPTEFAVQHFDKVSTDDRQSMVDISNQVRASNIVTYPDKTLLRLDESVVHRVNPVVESGMRTFIKITISDHKFASEGNSHNYLFDYDWDLKQRTEERNLDH